MDLSSDEKIDLIYDMLNKQESRYKRNLIWKWFFRVIIIWFIISFYAIILPKLDTAKLISEYIAPQMSKIIAPMAAESMKSMTANMMSWDLNSTWINMNDIQNMQTNWWTDSSKRVELLKRLKAMQNK
jgi:ABC-type phosphate/phosphonate transport system permease subunit